MNMLKLEKNINYANVWCPKSMETIVNASM